MPRKQNYDTKARRYILEYLKGLGESTVSAADILNFLQTKGEKISLTTVYRYLSVLSEEKKVIAFSEGKGGKNVYQFVKSDNSCDGHLHIQCKNCGRLIHLNCEFMNELKSHIESEHGFSLECTESILYGICKECR